MESDSIYILDQLKSAALLITVMKASISASKAKWTPIPLEKQHLVKPRQVRKMPPQPAMSGEPSAELSMLHLIHPLEGKSQKTSLIVLN